MGLSGMNATSMIQKGSNNNGMNMSSDSIGNNIENYIDISNNSHTLTIIVGSLILSITRNGADMLVAVIHNSNHNNNTHSSKIPSTPSNGNNVLICINDSDR